MGRKGLFVKLIIAIAMLFLSIYFARIIIKLNILPTNLIIILYGALISLNMIADLCLFLKGKWIKIVTVILDAILIFVSVIGINYGNSTKNFLNKAFDNNKYEITTYDVIVLNDSKVKNLNELKSSTLGYFSEDSNVSEMLAAINKKVVTDNQKYYDVYELYNALINKKVVSIVLDDSFIDTIKDEDKDIDKKTKIIYTFEIKKDKNKKEEPVKEEDYNKPINILLSGSDSRTTKIYSKSRSDVNMIVTINPKTKEVLLTSIPRDYYVPIYGKGGAKDKLTHAGIYGLDVSVGTVEELFGIEIDYSIKVGFQSVVKLVDIIGGIDIDSDRAFTSSSMPTWKVKKGTNHLDGKKALAYSRERYAYGTGDNHRIQNQQQIMTAVGEKLTSSTKLLTNYTGILEALSDLYITDIPSEWITNIVKETLSGGSWTFKSQVVSGTNSMVTTYTSPNSKRSVVIPDDNTVKTAAKKIKEVIEG